MQGLPLFFVVFAALAAAHDGRAQTVVHPFASETLAIQEASQDASVVALELAGKATTQYRLPFRVSSVAKLYADGPRSFLVGATGSFEFGASYGASRARVSNPDAVMIGYGFTISPRADYLAWVQFYPRLALAPDRGTVRLMKMRDAVGLTAPPDELRRDVGVVLFSAPSEEILLYPNIEWSGDGRLAFLSKNSAGQVQVIVCRTSTKDCRKVGSVEGKNQVTKLNFVPSGISLDLTSPASQKSKQIFIEPASRAG